jgi:hypothetical protein
MEQIGLAFSYSYAFIGALTLIHTPYAFVHVLATDVFIFIVTRGIVSGSRCAPCHVTSSLRSR